MEHYNYLIIGGGMTAAAAVKGIRTADENGAIAIISAENQPPYNRPPLSKGLWKGRPLEKIWSVVEPYHVDLFLGKTVVSLDTEQKQVLDDQGNRYEYDKLLLATGGTPRRLPFGGDEIIYFRNLDDYIKLRKLAEVGGKFGVIGGGFIGSEIAAALRMQDHQVVMLFLEQSIGALIFPEDLSQYVTEYYREKGVEVLPGRMVKGITKQGDQLVIETDQGEQLEVDHIVAGIGIRPNVELAQEAGIKVGDGILVDEYLQTSQPDVYAAGDVANFYNPALDKRIRVEHEENANLMGLIAGQNMAGKKAAYTYLPAFYSDLFDLGYEALGETNPTLQVVEDWQEPYRAGVLYYLDQKVIRGILLWNVWGKAKAARQLIGKPLPEDPEERITLPEVAG